MFFKEGICCLIHFKVFSSRCQQNFIFSFQHRLLHFPWLLLPKCQGASQWRRPCNAWRMPWSFPPPLWWRWLPPCTHSIGHDWSNQLGGQPEFFSSIVCLCGAKGFLGKSMSPSGTPSATAGRPEGTWWTHSTSSDPLRTQWSGPPFCGGRSLLVWYLIVGRLTMGHLTKEHFTIGQKMGPDTGHFGFY